MICVRWADTNTQHATRFWQPIVRMERMGDAKNQSFTDICSLIMMRMMMMMTMVMMMLTLKGAIRSIFTISSLRRKLSPIVTFKWPVRSRVQITCNTSGAYHVQRAVRHVVRRDSSAVKYDRVENEKPMKEVRKPEYPEKTLTISCRKCH